MNYRIREFAKRTIPKTIMFTGWTAYNQNKARQAREVFNQAALNPEWLGRSELEQLQTEFPIQNQSYTYDSESVDRRGRARVKELVKMAGRGQGPSERFLDLGSWDGMVCYYLSELGKTAVGVDNRIEGYSDKAIDAGTPLVGMDAGSLGFKDNTFDFVFSYNSFEHFPDPDLVLQEAIRVVRPGGQIYLSFGPLWLSPRGAHQFKTISVPYCECLFPVPIMEEFARDKELDLTDFAQMNKWTLTQYRELWPVFADKVDIKQYFETYNAGSVDLIVRYPSCFRSKTDVFDDLIVSNIDVLFVKREQGA